MICENCGADVPKTYEGSDGRKYCCPGCLFHPDGCRCKFGELGIVDDHSNYDEDFDDDPNEYEPDEPTCPDCWHQESYCVCEEEASAPAVVPVYAEFSDKSIDALLFCPVCEHEICICKDVDEAEREYRDQQMLDSMFD